MYFFIPFHAIITHIRPLNLKASLEQDKAILWLNQSKIKYIQSKRTPLNQH